MSDVQARTQSSDDGWGPARSVRSASYDRTREAPADVPAPGRSAARGSRSGDSSDTAIWQGGPAAPATGSSTTGSSSTGSSGRRRASGQRRSGTRSADTGANPGSSAAYDGPPATTAAVGRRPGISAVVALALLVVVLGLGAVVDALRGQQLGIGFNVAIIIGALLAMLFVRRSGMFAIAVAPPIVYSLAAGLLLYLRSSGLHNHSVLLDAAANWLVYGFPAIAAATALVLIVAGVRLIVRR